MSFVDFLYGTTVWQMGSIVCAFIVGGTVLAQVVVNRLWSRELRRANNDIAGFLIAVVGVIFAILVSSLAISVLNRHDRAEAAVAQEADMLEAMDREATLLHSGSKTKFRADVNAYLDAVIDREWAEMSRAEWPNDAERPLADIWDDIARLPVDSYAALATFQQLQTRFEKLAEIRRERGALATTGVHRVVWAVVLMGSVATILFAVLFGVPNYWAHLLMTSLLAFTIALALVMIIALDWPFFGNDVIRPDHLANLRTELHREAPGPS